MGGLGCAGLVALSPVAARSFDDPLVASSFLGRGSPDQIFAVALARDGTVYAAGRARERDYGAYPTTPGAYDETPNGDYDVVVSRLDGALGTLLASTFVGGSGYDGATTLALDYTSGSDEPIVVVAGLTSSTGFPTTPGAYDESHNGSSDVFVLRLDADLSTLLASTYVGGSSLENAFEPNTDRGPDLALAADGSVYVAGTTYSTDFPTTPPATGLLPFQQQHQQKDDVFVFRLSRDLDVLRASTFLGGDEDDRGTGVALDSAGHVFVTGHTESAPGWRPSPYDPFPITPGAYDATFNSAAGVLLEDGFVSRFDADLSGLEGSTFLGSASNDQVWAIAVDPGVGGWVFVAGTTPGINFPTTPGAWAETKPGYYDGFVSKLSGDLTELRASTYLGGAESDDSVLALGVDPVGNVWAAGYTWASDFPVTLDLGAPDLPPYYDPIYYTNKDVFVTVLPRWLNSGLQSLHFSGSQVQEAWDLSLVDEAGAPAVIAGWTESGRPADWSYPVTPGAYDTVADEGDGFVTIIPEPHALLQALVALLALGRLARAGAGSLQLIATSTRLRSVMSLERSLQDRPRFRASRLRARTRRRPCAAAGSSAPNNWSAT